MPPQLAVARSQGEDLPADLELAPRHADDDERRAVARGRDELRGVVDGEAVLGVDLLVPLEILERRLPGHLACVGIQGHEHVVQAAIEDLAVSVCDSLVVETAADGDVPQVVRPERFQGLVGPDLVAGRRIEREYVVVTVGDVHPAVDDDRRDLQFRLRVQDARVKDPGGLKPVGVVWSDLGVGSYLAHVLETRVVEVVAVARPIDGLFRWRGREAGRDEPQREGSEDQDLQPETN